MSGKVAPTTRPTAPKATERRRPARHVATPAKGVSTRALPADIAASVGAQLGFDFSQVDLHDDAAAGRNNRDQGSVAYAEGWGVHFSSGAYRPDTTEGRPVADPRVDPYRPTSSRHPRERRGAWRKPPQPPKPGVPSRWRLAGPPVRPVISNAVTPYPSCSRRTLAARPVLWPPSREVGLRPRVARSMTSPLGTIGRNQTGPRSSSATTTAPHFLR